MTRRTRSPRGQVGFACGSKEESVYFPCFGGFAAKTREKDSHFPAAAGEQSQCGVSKYA
jgi:hypothetical protein